MKFLEEANLLVKIWFLIELVSGGWSAECTCLPVEVLSVQVACEPEGSSARPRSTIVYPLGMTGASAEGLPPELAMQVFRAVQEYIAGAVEGEPESAGRRIGEVVGLGMVEVTAALQKLRKEGWVNVGRHVIVGPHQTVGAMAVLSADKITLFESASVSPLMNIDVLTIKASRSGIAGLGNLQVFTLVLVWLLAVGIPIVQQELPKDMTTILSNEYGTVGLAVAVTSVILTSRRH